MGIENGPENLQPRRQLNSREKAMEDPNYRAWLKSNKEAQWNVSPDQEWPVEASKKPNDLEAGL